MPILEEIYATIREGDKVLLDNAHAHLAHLIAQEYTDEHVEMMIKGVGIHCDRKARCDASGGSLGHAIGIAIGMSKANPKIKIHVIVSDGSIMEGSNWEALRIIADNKLDQIHIYCNFNGYTAVSNYRSEILEKRIKALEIPNMKFYHTNNGEGFEGLQGHYRKI